MKLASWYMFPYGGVEGSRLLMVKARANPPARLEPVHAHAYDPQLTVLPESQINGRYGRGPVNSSVETQSGVVLGVTEVKAHDFRGGIAQNVMQIDSALVNRKRKDA